MGWSWALYFANAAVNEMVARARGGDHDWLLRERTPLPRLRVDRPVGGVYVDNITLLGISIQQINLVSFEVQKQADRQGLPLVWTHTSAVQCLESVGVVLDLATGS